MVPGKIGDGQAELKVLGLDVDVDVAHHVHQELDSIFAQGHVFAGCLLENKQEWPGPERRYESAKVTFCQSALNFGAIFNWRILFSKIWQIPISKI